MILAERARLAGGRLERLWARSAATLALRVFFLERGFLDVETPALVPSPGLEPHLDAFEVAGAGWLQTSPEYQMKRLLAAGVPRLYQVCRCFRRGEVGPLHNPEFTIVEWYRAGEPYEAIMADLEALAVTVARAVRGTTTVTRGGEPLSLDPPWPRLTVREAMLRHADLDLEGDEPRDRLADKARRAGVRVAPDDGWDDVFHRIFLERVEPALGRGRPTIVTEWPTPLAALARRKPGDPRVAERFEVYAAGLELANAYGELVDPVEQRARLEAERAARAAAGRPLYPIDERFLAALEQGLPDPSSGVALGLDRLLMLLLEAETIRDVVAFTVDEL